MRRADGAHDENTRTAPGRGRRLTEAAHRREHGSAHGGRPFDKVPEAVIFFAMPKVPAGAQTVQSNGETFVVFEDGAAWLAVRPGWEDIQSSPTGTGATPAAAITHLLHEERQLASADEGIDAALGNPDPKRGVHADGGNLELEEGDEPPRHDPR